MRPPSPISIYIPTVVIGVAIVIVATVVVAVVSVSVVPFIPAIFVSLIPFVPFIVSTFSLLVGDALRGGRRRECRARSFGEPIRDCCTSFVCPSRRPTGTTVGT